MPLNFHGAEPFLNPVEQTICWNGDDGRRKVPCKVTSSALDALYGTAELTEEDRWIIFNRHRGIFEAIAYQEIRCPSDNGARLGGRGDCRRCGLPWQVRRVSQTCAGRILLIRPVENSCQTSGRRWSPLEDGYESGAGEILSDPGPHNDRPTT